MAALGVAVAVLGCSLPGLITIAPESSVEIPSTPTTASPQLAPVDEIELANALETQVVGVYDQSAAAVVNITTRVIGYDFFMRPVPQDGGTGSGFIYDDQGHVVTNYHVVENAESVSVALADGEVLPAEVVGVDPSTDLAVLRVSADGLPAPIPLGDSDQLRVGQFVLAIGNPFGQEGTLTMGVISALGRVIESPDGRFIGEAIQTDASINPGNSGGPLLDLQGRVIGVTSQIISPVRGSTGIGFAVSSNAVRRVVPQLIAFGRYPHPWLGIYLLELSPEWASALSEAGMQVPVDEGILITDVYPGSPVDQAGVRGGDSEVLIRNVTVPIGGDILVAINGELIISFEELTVYLETETLVGDIVELTLYRDGQELTIPVTLAERP
jgi:S1-C subfamily serine protease